MRFAITCAAAVICVLVALSDFRTRRIPNALPVAIAVLGLVRLGCAQNPLAETCTLAAAGIVFAVTLVLFRCGAMGGGDSKMITATTLVVGYQQVLGFLFLMSLCGGALALATLATEKLECTMRRQHDKRQGVERRGVERRGVERRGVERLTVPYGIAVAAAGIVSLIVAR